MAGIPKVTHADFEEKVLKSELPVLIDFSGVWCAPCKMIEPCVEKIAKEYEGRLKVYELDVDESPQIAAKYQILSIPALLIFKDGVPVKSIVGAVPYKVIKKKVEEVIGK